MISNQAKLELEKQQYRIVGDHSAVKICAWTKKMIKGEGGCYKLKFYGIMSNQCMQMTTSISCANRCTFCWRGYKAPVAKEWEWNVDDPDLILKKSKEAHHDLLVGFKGNKKLDSLDLYNTSKTIKHVALSLTGEPIIYPKINELIKEFNKEGISTFLVTNGQYPEQVRDLNPVTQLYLSVDAPDKVSLKEIDKPLFEDYWERLNKALDYLKEKKQRTTIRLTLVRGINTDNMKRYKTLIEKGDPDFIEVKGYVWVGASRQRLEKKNMPEHEVVVELTKELLEVLPDYEYVTEHIPSRVVLLAKKKFKINGNWHTWIDFPKYHKLALENNFKSEDYTIKTPDKFLEKESLPGLQS